MRARFASVSCRATAGSSIDGSAGCRSRALARLRSCRRLRYAPAQSADERLLVDRRGERRGGGRCVGPRDFESGRRDRRGYRRAGRHRRGRRALHAQHAHRPAGSDRRAGGRHAGRRDAPLVGQAHAAHREWPRRSPRDARVRFGARAVQGVRVLGPRRRRPERARRLVHRPARASRTKAGSGRPPNRRSNAGAICNKKSGRVSPAAFAEPFRNRSTRSRLRSGDSANQRLKTPRLPD